MKKIVFFIALILSIVSAALPAGALDYYDITDISENLGQSGIYIDGRKISAMSDVSHLAAIETVRPGTKIFVAVTTRDFKWGKDSPKPVIDEQTVKTLGITVSSDVGYDENNGVIKRVSIDEYDGKTGILIEFVDIYAGTLPLDFNTVVRLMVDGREYHNGTFAVGGSFRNRCVFVYSRNKSIKLGSDRMAEAAEDVRDMTFDLGDGISIKANLYYSEKAYGAVSQKLTDADREVIAMNPAIQKVYHLTTINLLGKVSFDVEGSFYVYDGDMNYLGTTAEAVALADVYYLSTRQIAG